MADLKPGTHQLRFASPVDDERWSEALVNVGDRPKVVRHAIGRTESPSAGNLAAVLLTLGASAVIIGGSLYGAGMLVSTERGQPVKDAGLVTLGAGGGAVLLGIPLLILLRPVKQLGSTTEMRLAQ